MELRDVVEAIYGTDMDKYNWVQPYTDITWNGIAYKHLATVPGGDWTKIGLGYYPIFDETYRPVLNGKILDYFFMREIGVETIDLWLQFTRTKMQTIMPFYNQMYESQQIQYTALDTMRIDSQRDETLHSEDVSNGTNNATATTNALSRAVNSDTPQTMLSGDEDYASSATDGNAQNTATNSTTASGDNTSDGTNNTNSLTTGYQGAASDLIRKYRDSFINVDMMIFAEMQPLFMGILNSSDDYSNGSFYYGY
jgi:hypothetical protein